MYKFIALDSSGNTLAETDAFNISHINSDEIGAQRQQIMENNPEIEINFQLVNAEE